MTIKLVVSNRVETLTPEGPVVGVVLNSVSPEGAPKSIVVLVRIEIGNLNPDNAKNFPLGRMLEITIPTYNGSRILVPGN